MTIKENTELNDLGDLNKLFNDESIKELLDGFQNLDTSNLADFSIDTLFANMMGTNINKMKKKITDLSLYSKIKDIQILAERNKFKLKNGKKIFAMARSFVKDLKNRKDAEVKIMRYKYYLALDQLYKSLLEIYNQTEEPIDTAEKSDIIICYAFNKLFSDIIEETKKDEENSKNSETDLMNIFNEFTNILNQVEEGEEKNMLTNKILNLKNSEILLKEVDFNTFKENTKQIISESLLNNILKDIEKKNLLDNDNIWSLVVEPKNKNKEKNSKKGFDFYVTTLYNKRIENNKKEEGKYKVEFLFWNSIDNIKESKFDEEILENFMVTYMTDDK